MRVQVLTVTRATEGLTGSTVYQIAFGRIAPLTVEVRQRLQDAGAQVPPGPEVAANSLILFFSFEGTVPYRIGSEWELDVGADGTLSVKEVGHG
jgi:hypothetical protein